MSSKENSKNSFGNNKYHEKLLATTTTIITAGVKDEVVGTITEAKGHHLNQDPILKILVGDHVANSAIGQGSLLGIVTIEWTNRVRAISLHHILQRWPLHIPQKWSKLGMQTLGQQII